MTAPTDQDTQVFDEFLKPYVVGSAVELAQKAA